MTTDACSLHIVEQARAAGDKVVVDISPLGSALPSRPILLSGRFRGLPLAIMAPAKVGTRLTLVLLLVLTPTVATLYLLEHQAFHPNLNRRSEVRGPRDQPLSYLSGRNSADRSQDPVSQLGGTEGHSPSSLK
jgi:hypothetical protein